jgi:glycosyltransferase involved in cell wall biosynthesis
MPTETPSFPGDDFKAANKMQRPSLNIWWVSQYASTPDQQFTAQYDLASKLVKKGHRVTFFAAGFSHYKFEEIRLKGGESWREELCNGVRFVWIKTPPYRTNNWRRAYNLCSFAGRAYWNARRRQEVPDLVIGTTFHPLSSLCAYCISVSKGRPFVFEVKDLWPLTMIEFGKLSSKSPLAVILRFLEKFLARRASKIMTTLPGVGDYYAKLGIPKEKTVWIPNGLELSRYASLKPYDGHLSVPCVLLYAGGHVSANALEMVIRAAKIVQETDNGVQFVFVGGGQEKPRLVQLARELNLRNIRFMDAVPKSELHQIMAGADAFVLSMRDLPGLYRYGMSFNKLCDYVASGRPVLFAGNSSYNVVKEFACGIVVPPENPQAFAGAVREFMSLTDEQRAEMGRNGIRCAKERFDISVLGDRLEQMLLSVHDDSRGRPGASRDSSKSRIVPQNAGTTEAGSKNATVAEM